MNRSVLNACLLIPLVLVPALMLNAGEPAPGSQQPLTRAETSLILADGVSATEAVRLALRQNPGLLALRKGRAVAEGGVAEAKALSDPEFRTGRFDIDDDWARIRDRNYNLGVRWSPPRPGERKLKGGWALGRVSEVDGEILTAEQRLAAEVRLLHLSIVFLDEQIKLAEEAVKVREQIVDMLETQVELGAVSILDQGVAELALADARALPSAHRLDRRVSMGRLTGELGLPRFTDLEIQAEGEPLVYQPRPLEDARLIEQALANRPELAIVSARCSQADTLLSLKKKELYPWFSFLQVNRQLGEGYGTNSWGFRLGVDLPVFKWQREITRAPAAESEQCQLEYQALENSIAMEVVELVEMLRARFDELELYNQTIEPLISRDVEVAERALAIGQGNMMQRLMAEARRLRRRQTYVSSLLECRHLEIGLDQALGNAIPQ